MVPAVDLGGLATIDGGRTRSGMLYLADSDPLTENVDGVLVDPRLLALTFDLGVEPFEPFQASGRVVPVPFTDGGGVTAVQVLELLAAGEVPALLAGGAPRRSELVAGAVLGAARVRADDLDHLGPRATVLAAAIEAVGRRPGGADAWFRELGAPAGIGMRWRAMFVHRPPAVDPGGRRVPNGDRTGRLPN
jgi:hypothetical protein